MCILSLLWSVIGIIFIRFHVLIVVHVVSSIFSVVFFGSVVGLRSLRSCFLILGGCWCLNSSCIVLCRCWNMRFGMALTGCWGWILYVCILNDFWISNRNLSLCFLLSLLALGWRSLL